MCVFPEQLHCAQIEAGATMENLMISSPELDSCSSVVMPFEPRPETDPWPTTPRPTNPPYPPKKGVAAMAGGLRRDGVPVRETRDQELGPKCAGKSEQAVKQVTKASDLEVRTAEPPSKKQQTGLDEACTEDEEHNYKADETFLPPLAISPATIFAVFELHSHFTNLECLICMYDELEASCKDTPVYRSFAWQLIDEIRRIVHSVKSTYRRNQTGLEQDENSARTRVLGKVAEQVLAIEAEAFSDWEDSIPGRKPENSADLKSWISVHYVGTLAKALAKVGTLGGSADTVELEEALILWWQEKAESSVKEAEELRVRVQKRKGTV